MSIFINLWNSWSTYEKIKESALLLTIFLIIVISIYYATKNKKFVILTTVSLLITALLNLVGFVLTDILTQVQITEVFRLVPIISSIFLVSNLGILVGFYISKRNTKKFNYEDIRKEYLSDTLKQSIFLLLLFASIFLFVSSQTQIILTISLVSVTVSIWITYWISRYILK